MKKNTLNTTDAVNGREYGAVDPNAPTETRIASDTALADPDEDEDEDDDWFPVDEEDDDEED